MRSSGIKLAHLAAFAALTTLAGCSDSHGRDELDAGPLPDSGAVLDSSAPPDSGFPRDSGFSPDSGLPPDAGPRGSCDAQLASSAVCPEVLCDGPSTWYWNGDSCFAIECGACEGADCGSGSGSEDGCMAAHASCEPALCTTSGGDWLWWAEECGHFSCGFPPPVDCILGMPVCDCGAGRSFEAGVGCVAADCPEVDPLPRNVACTSSGGTWAPICCDTVCGIPCAAACLADACDCGPGRVFDSLRGCIDATRCHEPLEGESCGPESRCEGSSICCARCGGAGCFESTCTVPVCDADPHTDSCGNRDDVP